MAKNICEDGLVVNYDRWIPSAESLVMEISTLCWDLSFWVLELFGCGISR